MTVLAFNGHLYGPFLHVVDVGAEVLCDDQVWPKTVIGEGFTLLTDPPGPLDRWDYVDGAWVELTPPQPAVLVPEKVSRLQAKMALALTGQLAAIEAAVVDAASGQEGELALLYWNDASDFHRQHYLVQSITAGLGMTTEQVDQLFINAATLAVA